MRIAIFFLLAQLVACKKENPTQPPAAIKVAAASDLALAFKEMGTQYEARTGQPVSFSFGSSGLLAKQISEGAPFDAFASANLSYVDDTVKSGACFGATKLFYGEGRIVLWAKTTELLPRRIDDLKDPKYSKIAIANPDHAPYGLAAKQALIKAGLWEAVSTHIVYGENIQQTLQFAQSGNADVAIVARSLMDASLGEYTAIDSALHDRIQQAIVVCKGSPPSTSPRDSANGFLTFIDSQAGKDILRKYGYLDALPTVPHDL